MCSICGGLVDHSIVLALQVKAISEYSLPFVKFITP